MVETHSKGGEFSPEEREQIAKAVKSIVAFEPEMIEDVLNGLSLAKNNLAIACIKTLDTNPPTEKLVQEMTEMRHEVAIIKEVIGQTKAARQLLGKDEFYNAMSEHGLIESQE